MLSSSVNCTAKNKIDIHGLTVRNVPSLINELDKLHVINFKNKIIEFLHVLYYTRYLSRTLKI